MKKKWSLKFFKNDFKICGINSIEKKIHTGKIDYLQWNKKEWKIP